MVGEVVRIVGGAVDERRLAAPQERHAHQVHARRIVHDAAVVGDVALAVDNGDVEPRVVGTEASRPDDRLDLTPCQVETERRRLLDPCRIEAMRWLDLTIDRVAGSPLVDRVEEPSELQVRERALIAQRA